MGLTLIRRKKKEGKEYGKDLEAETEYTLYRFMQTGQLFSNFVIAQS